MSIDPNRDWWSDGRFGWVTVREEDTRELHVVPDLDLLPHYLGRSCWCAPVEDAEEAEMLLHNARDGREKHEPAPGKTAARMH